MTANMIKGKEFSGALHYNIKKVNKGVAEVLDHNFQSTSEKTILYEVSLIKAYRPNLKKFFYHTSINFPPSENLTNSTMLQIGKDFLSESGFNQHQYIMFRHHDADHPHLHILVNRIGYDKKVLSDSNDYARTENVLRKLEKKYNLTEVISSKQAKVRAMTKDEMEMMKRTDVPSAKMRMQYLIKEALTSKPKLTSSEFIQALEERGINVLFNQASTGYVSGISYSYEGITITGSKLGNDFKWTTIQSVINYEQERDRAAIQQTNIRTTNNKPDSSTSSIRIEGNSTPLPDGSATQSVGEKSNQDNKLSNSSDSKKGRRSKRTTGNSNTTKRNQSQSSPNSERLNLASILDSFFHRNSTQVESQPVFDPAISMRLDSNKKKRRRKKRR